MAPPNATAQGKFKKLIQIRDLSIESTIYTSVRMGEEVDFPIYPVLDEWRETKKGSTRPQILNMVILMSGTLTVLALLDVTSISPLTIP